VGTLEGKVAIVAGSSRGIGKAIARVYAREGARVAVVARSETAGKLPGTIGETAAEIRSAGGVALPVRCDIVDEGDVEAMVQRVQAELGPVDILVNSAAVILYNLLTETPFKRWEQIFRDNVHGAFLLSKAVLPGMIERRSGNIVQLTSMGAVRWGKGGNAYGATKAALERYCFGLAAEVKQYNIAVNCLDPGPVKTEGALFTRGERADWSNWVEPMEVGPVALYLARQTAATMTGQVVRRTEYKG
jgi:NAD(P)-dependent dehydrogenase (short-subunit alcohol dehydrogenase family)